MFAPQTEATTTIIPHCVWGGTASLSGVMYSLAPLSAHWGLVSLGAAVALLRAVSFSPFTDAFGLLASHRNGPCSALCAKLDVCKVLFVRSLLPSPLHFDCCLVWVPRIAVEVHDCGTRTVHFSATTHTSSESEFTLYVISSVFDGGVSMPSPSSNVSSNELFW